MNRSEISAKVTFQPSVGHTQAHLGGKKNQKENKLTRRSVETGRSDHSGANLMSTGKRWIHTIHTGTPLVVPITRMNYGDDL